MNYVLDDSGNKYKIKDINKFFQHLLDFHTNEERKPDNSSAESRSFESF